MTASEWIKEKISSKGTKLTFISQKTEIPIDTISKILSKKRRFTADEFISICSAIDVDPNEFRQKSD